MGNFKVYGASKIWHAPMWQTMRAELHNIVSRWIDLTDDNPIVQNQKDVLWRMCFEDVQACDYLVLYSGDEKEEQRGALVELGMAMGMNKPIFAINRCKSLRASPISDVAFTHFDGFTWLDATSMREGLFEARERFANNQ